MVEEPLEIRLRGVDGRTRPLTVTMRTPGDDLDLALGFLFTEGVIGGPADVVAARLCTGDRDLAPRQPTVRDPVGGGAVDGGPVDVGPADEADDEPHAANVVEVTLAPHVPPPDGLHRHFVTTSACGICGKTSIDTVRTRARFTVADDPVRVSPAVLATLPDRLRAGQRLFAQTGGLHAAGLFTADGELVVLREDVGRHNAVDKVIGWALRAGRLPLSGHLLLVSGRAGFELVQKAWMAGVPVMAAVSAPSTLAVELAEQAGMTLVGFLRGATMNAYTGTGRLLSTAPVS